MSLMIKCPVCNEYETHEQRRMNLHKYHCENKQLRNQTDKEPKKEQQPGTCPGGCNWVLLNPNNDMQRLAMERGYSKLCKTCQEIR